MKSIYKHHRFPPEIISHAIWLYHRFTLSFREVEDLLAERGITVSYEAIRYWSVKFGSTYTRSLCREQGRLGDIWQVDEIFITIRGERHYLWRAADQDGDVIDILVTKRRDRQAAKRFFRKALKHQYQVLFQRTENGARRTGVAVVHQKRQAKRLIFARRHPIESQIFQDIYSRSKQSSMDVTNIVTVLRVADGDIIQAEKDNSLINQIIGSRRIQVNVIFNKYRRCVALGRVSCFEKQAFSFLIGLIGGINALAIGRSKMNKITFSLISNHFNKIGEEFVLRVEFDNGGKMVAWATSVYGLACHADFSRTTHFIISRMP